MKSFRLGRRRSAKHRQNPRAGTPLGEELASQLARRRGGVPARFVTASRSTSLTTGFVCGWVLVSALGTSFRNV